MKTDIERLKEAVKECDTRREHSLFQSDTRNKIVFIQTKEDILNLDSGESGIYWTGHLSSAVKKGNNKDLKDVYDFIMRECYEVDKHVSNQDIIKTKKNAPYYLIQKVSSAKIKGISKAFDYIIIKK